MTQAALGEIGRMEQLHAAPSAILRDCSRSTSRADVM